MGFFSDLFKGAGGALIGGVSSLVGGAQANSARRSEATRAGQFNQASAREQMDFQERMSNTAHVRQMDDLKKAGLNPLLSAKYGGASSPGGSSATRPLADQKDFISPAISSALAIQQNKANIDLTRAQTENTRQKTVTEEINQGNQMTENTKLQSQIKNLGQEFKNLSQTERNLQKDELLKGLEEKIKTTEDKKVKEELSQLRMKAAELRATEEFWTIVEEYGKALAIGLPAATFLATILNQIGRKKVSKRDSSTKKETIRTDALGVIKDRKYETTRIKDGPFND